MAESLPQELMDAIIDEVHSTSDLKACLLACHTFSSPTRAILFRQIKLTESQLDADAVQRFHELCVVSPHIPLLVQTLYINGYRCGPTFLAVFDIISCVLQYMQSLKVIEFYCVTIGNWTTGMVSSHLFCEIHLTDVIFHENGFRQMCAVIRGSPDLERLFVYHNHPPVFGGNATSQLSLDNTHCRACIQDLSIVSRHSYSFIEAILDTKTCPMSIEELRWFQFTLTRATDFQHLAKILQLTSCSLQVLLLTFKCASPRQRPLLFPELPIIGIGHLRNIALMVTDHGLQYLQWWIQSLMRVTQSNQLPTLQFLDIELGTSYCWNPVASPEWSELDQILLSPLFDKSFRMLMIKVRKRRAYKISQEETRLRPSLWGQRARCRESAEDIVEDMVSQLEVQFPWLTGKLRFSVKEY
ncbi:hypothetical protein EV421DRAFT_1911833 [Armillaria borealis]|uniref:F-box domain-containing protein n=1 Tax=Armillaria borealis TaxID=47425 RepID=A0AA39IYH7_9AGAR|nr:hypothetical protein EV421DRAFT_1911833 [Armillaria borealis]